MYDAKLKDNDGTFRSNIIADSGYFTRTTYYAIANIPASYVPIEDTLINK
ncbi:MAG: hypothetical protein PHX70_06810 [Clostridium sp.]|nr:hypothetical protein [Clostridium sp.]